MKGKEINTFEKGEHLDFSPEFQPKGSYRKGLNIIRDENGQIKSEKGTLEEFQMPSGLSLLSYYNLGGKLILFLGDSQNTISEIGILDETNSYEAYISNRTNSNARLLLSENLLAFFFSSPPDVEARFLFDGDIVIYFVDGINGNRTINLNDLPDEEGFNEKIELQFSYSLPKADLSTVGEGGSLETGTYILVPRYLTSGGNATALGTPTNPINIIDDSEGSNVPDGALPQTSSSKSISITITNIDQNFPFLEIIGITFEGIANVPVYTIVGRLEITGESLQTFTYLNNNQDLGNVIEEELSANPVIYGPAKHIEQKDNVLLLSNLKSGESNVDPLEFQEIANNVTIKYDIYSSPTVNTFDVKVDGVPWTETGNTIGLTGIPSGNPEFDPNQTVQATVNISGGHRNEVTASIAKSYMRNEVYSFAIVPIYISGAEGFAYHIPGKDLVNTAANTTTKELGTYISDETYPSGKGYPTGNVRHHRMPSLEQERLLVIDEDSNGRTTLQFLGISLEFGYLPESIKKEIQGFKIVRQSRNISSNRSIVVQGLVKRFFNISGSFVTPIPSFGHIQLKGLFGDSFTTQEVDTDSDLIGFYAPDEIHGMIEDVNADQLEKLGTYTGKYLYAGTGEDNDMPGNNLVNYGNKLDTSTKQSPIDLNSEHVKLDEVSYIGIAGGGGITLPFGSVSSCKVFATNGLLIYAKQNSSDSHPAPYRVSEVYDDQIQGGAYYTYVEGSTSVQPQVHLCNLLRNLSNQYGRVEDAEYLFAGVHLFGVGDSDSNDLTTNRLMYGDTYISKYGLTMSDTPFSEDDIASFSSINFFYVETIGNYNFRHYVNAATQDENIDKSSLPYFPKYSTLFSATAPIGLFDYPAELGHSKGYNKQYSKENDTKTFVPKPLLFEQIDNFPNRTIRSEISFEGETADNYRIFLANNFQDIPKDKGEITNTFIWDNFFYIHTERGLFKAYVNNKELIITEASQIVTGTGGIFSQQPTELFDLDGGYLGTTSKYAGIVTPYGYFFIANSRGKVFQLTDRIKEISDTGQRNFFYDNIEVLEENILENIGFVSGFDYLNNRYLLTKLGENGFTKSYAIKLESWTGSHSQKPNWYLNRNKQFLLYSNFSLHELNVGNRASYFGSESNNVSITLILNHPRMDKKYDAIKVRSRSKDGEGVLKPYKFFNTIRCYNDDQNSDLLNIIVTQEINPILASNEIKAAYKKRDYKISIPFDAVKLLARDQDIFNSNNLDLTRKFRGRMVSDYLVTELNITDTENFDFYLDFIETHFRI